MLGRLSAPSPRLWRRRVRRGLGLFAIGLCGGLAVLLVCLVLLPGTGASLARRGEDLTLRLADRLAPHPPAATLPPVVVVDIDAASLERLGPWPWRREVIARLVQAARKAGARAIGLDILFAGPDQRSPAALARALTETLDTPALTELAAGPDDDALLAAALAGSRAVLGFALAPTDGPAPARVPILIRDRAALGPLWQAAGAEAPPPALVQAAAGIGALAIAGDADGPVRRLPLLVALGADLRPGLALELARVATGGRLLKIDGAANRFETGGLAGPLGPDGMVRLRPGAPAPRILSAADLLAAPSPGLPEGAIVLIGGSAPQLGGLRTTADGALVPTVALQAAALGQILAGDLPVPPAWISRHPAAPALIAVGIGALIAALPPLAAALATLAAVTLVAAVALGAAHAGLLIDPALPALALVAAALSGGLAATLARMRLARDIRRRFEQHLSPAVVALIARDPESVKLDGQRREVTALFTDVEGFTPLTRRAGPEALIALLDTYFEGLSGLIQAHGGMIDKFVGDAVHAFFNAPLDQPDHARAAVRCALAIAEWSAAFRETPEAAALDFGRTRIGIETGSVIVGDVGVATKLDYTAYGDAVNAAARLEARNKELGTTICIGPATAALCPPGWLRESGHGQLRGFDTPITTWEPVPGTLPDP